MSLVCPGNRLTQQIVQLMIDPGGSHRFMWLCGNFHSKPEMPFYKGLNLPLTSVLSVNQDIDRVKEDCKKLNLHNVHLIGHVLQSELAPYLYAADVLIVPTSKSWKLSETTSPLKLFEYMVAKRPIVASALPTIMTVLRDKENALLAEPDEPLSFKEAIVNLFESPLLARAIAERAFQEVQDFTWDKRVDRVLQFAAEKLHVFDKNVINYRRNLLRIVKKKVMSASYLKNL